MRSLASKPSSSTSSWFSVWSCSRLKPWPVRAAPTASSSSMKMIAGAFLRAFLEELADARRAESREHLDECRGALRIELCARLGCDGLRHQRLAGPGRAIEQDSLRHPRAEPFEALGRAQELDDLRQLLLHLLQPGDVAQPIAERAAPRSAPAARAASSAASARAG
jgi:hypothetical protein